jgi:Ca2+-binding RTX toxin-like protein
VVEGASGGTDTVQSAQTYTLGAELENLTLTGTAAINGTGNALNNTINGNSGANLLDGGAGADAMAGGAGDDTYFVDNTSDTATEAAGAGLDTVRSSVTFTLGSDVETLILTGSTATSATGNGSDNVLDGSQNSAANTLTGNGGNDTYIVGSGDTVVEKANGGTDTVQSGLTYTLGSNVENLTLIGTSAINGTGNTANNTLTGNSANNVLTGLGGNDTFLYNRGGGQDTVVDNSGSDTMLFGATINPIDLVFSQSGNDLRISLHGSSDRVTIQNWFSGATNQTELIQADNGQDLLNTQVSQLIQAMAGFTQQTGLTWDQGIDQQPQQVQAILAASWQ